MTEETTESENCEEFLPDFVVRTRTTYIHDYKIKAPSLQDAVVRIENVIGIDNQELLDNKGISDWFVVEHEGEKVEGFLDLVHGKTKILGAYVVKKDIDEV